jgi:OmcA/MtrC family decaheme c-type cytochrome
VWTGSSISILLGWSTTDYHNAGNGSATTPASTISLNGRAVSSGNNAAPVANADGTFTVTSLRAVPASGTTGSGTAGMTVRAGGDFDGDGTYTDRVPVRSVVKFFPITDATAVARRDVVDIAQCNQCHDQLTLHGSGRTDEPQLCVLCHNANNTDIARRPADPTTTVDGKKEESIDFKTMIHAIHAAARRETPLTVYGFGSSANTYDTSLVHFPGLLNDCNACHKPETFTVPLQSGVLANTIDSGASRPDPSDDTNITPTAAVCSSCHDTDLAQLHMEQNGANFLMSGDPGAYNETCAICHGPGRLADVAEVHALAP